MEIAIIIILLLFNSYTVYKFIFNSIFNDMDDFKKSLRYSLTPDLISLFKGEYLKDQFGELKFGLFIIVCIVATVIEYSIINGLFRFFMRL